MSPTRMDKEVPQKIAIVYDWIDKWGGVERLLLTLHDIFPQSDFYTSYYDPVSAPWAKDLNIQTSFIQKLPRFIRKSRVLSLILYPYAFESFNLSKYDLVISVSSSFAKSVITRPETLHISYLLTPTRFLWVHPELYINKFPILGKKIAHHLKKWDLIVSNRPDKILGISQTVVDRIATYYQKDANVLYPPFDELYWGKIKEKVTATPKNNYFLVVSRLEPYKKIDLAIKVINKLKDKTLLIIGTGSEEKKLKQLAGDNIHFIKHIKDEELSGYYMGADALIMPQEEDFGYVALEAQYFGCPVVAYKKGGALETIIEGKTGIFFTEQTEQSLARALERWSKMSYNLKQSIKDNLEKHIRQFSKDNFRKTLVSVIKNS